MERMTFAQALAADLTDEGIERNVLRIRGALRWLVAIAAVALAVAGVMALS